MLTTNRSTSRSAPRKPRTHRSLRTFPFFASGSRSSPRSPSEPLGAPRSAPEGSRRSRSRPRPARYVVQTVTSSGEAALPLRSPAKALRGRPLFVRTSERAEGIGVGATWALLFASGSARGWWRRLCAELLPCVFPVNRSSSFGERRLSQHLIAATA